MNARTIAIIAIVLLALAGIYIAIVRPGSRMADTDATQPASTTTTPTSAIANVTSFEQCRSAGYPVTTASTGRRQCRMPDGRVYAEEVPQQGTYVNATSNDIRVSDPEPGAVTGKTFTIKGQARGSWYFEASFPVEVLDKNGKVIFNAPAQAQGEWMTSDFVPFSLQVTVPESYIGPATLVLKKDNPSGLKERDASLSIPITIEY